MFENMEKVYVPRITTFVLGVLVIGFPFFLKDAFDFKDYIIFFVGALFFLFALLGNIYPYFSYDESGLQFNALGIRKYFFKWNEFEGVRTTTVFQTGIGVYTKNGNQVFLSSYGTRNFLKVLSDIVRYVRKNNPNAIIDRSVLKRLEKYDLTMRGLGQR
jgi:hypothetical protein